MQVSQRLRRNSFPVARRDTFNTVWPWRSPSEDTASEYGLPFTFPSPSEVAYRKDLSHRPIARLVIPSTSVDFTVTVPVLCHSPVTSDDVDDTVPLTPCDDLDATSNNPLGVVDFYRKQRGLELTPTTPSNLGRRRYECTRIATRGFMPVTAGMFSSVDNRSYHSHLPSGWREIIHPEGQPYYYHDAHHIVAVARMRDPTIARQMAHFVKFFTALEAAHLGERSPLAEIVLELDPKDDNVCHYYIADYKQHVIYWVEEMHGHVSWELGFPGAVTEPHMRLFLEQCFSEHVQYYPHRPLPKEIEGRILGLVSFTWMDRSTSDLSTSPFTTAQLKDFDRLIEATKDLPEECVMYRTSTLARLWSQFLMNQVANMHGTESARLARTTCMSGQPPQSAHPLIRILTMVLLFNAPENQFQAISKLWVDEIAYVEHWLRFLKSRLEQWQHVTVVATVLLTVNVGYLAIPAVDAVGEPNFMGSLQHYSSSISTVFSFASMFDGLLLICKHWNYEELEASQATEYLINHSQWGLYPLAIFFSLPYVFLLWGVAFFGVAFISFAIRRSGVFGIMLFTVLSGIITFLILLNIHFFWRAAEEFVGAHTLGGASRFGEHAMSARFKAMIAALRRRNTDRQERPPSPPALARIRSVLREYLPRRGTDTTLGNEHKTDVEKAC